MTKYLYDLIALFVIIPKFSLRKSGILSVRILVLCLQVLYKNAHDPDVRIECLAWTVASERGHFIPGVHTRETVLSHNVL